MKNNTPARRVRSVKAGSVSGGSLLDQPIAISLLTLALPSIVAMLSQTAVSIAEVWYVGRLGTGQLAGLALVFPLYMLMTTLSAGALGGMVAGSVARVLGAGDPARADRIAWNAMFLTIVIGMLVSVFFSVNAHSIFIWLGASNDSLEHASEYASVMFSGVTVIWVFNVLNAILRGSGQMKLSALITIAVVCIQIPLMGALVLGWGGYIQLGLVGSPVAILLAFGAGTIVSIIALVRNGSAVRLSRRGFHFDPVMLRAIGGRVPLQVYLLC